MAVLEELVGLVELIELVVLVKFWGLVIPLDLQGWRG